MTIRTTLVKARHRASIVTAGALLAGTISAFTAPVAHAAGAVINSGDIAVTTFGGLFDGGSGLDKVGPAPDQRTRLASFGVGTNYGHLSTAKNGDLFAANTFGEVRRVDHTTGSQTVIKAAFDADYLDLVVDRDQSSVVALARTPTGTQLIRVTKDGAVNQLSGDSRLAEAQSVAMEADGRVLVTAGSILLRINPGNSQVSQAFALGGSASGMVPDRDGRILVHVATGSTSGKIVRVDPGNGFPTTLAIGGMLNDYSAGLALDPDGNVITNEYNRADDTISVVRVNLVSRSQTLLARLASAQALDVTVAGVSQIGGPVKPTATNDSYAMNIKDGQLRTGGADAPSALANDRDPFGQKLEYLTSTQPTHGFISAFADGTFFYFPNAGFTGVDSWTYTAHTPDGRFSAPVTISVRVDPDSTPIARNDHFFTAYETGFAITVPGVLANDTDPQGERLSAKLLTPPAQGDISLTADGRLVYQPPAHFSGDVTFTYAAVDLPGHASKPATVTISVAPNSAPTVTVPAHSGLKISAGNDLLSGTFPLEVADKEKPGQLTVTGTSSDQAIVANSGIKIATDGGSRRAVTITTKGVKGTAVVTMTVSDGEKSATVAIVVIVGSNANETLIGTDGPDLLVGMAGKDVISGAGGRDVITGGAGDDTFTGGAGGDFFRGGPGVNHVTDLGPDDETLEVQ